MGIVAKYKYDGSVYADLIPEFNAEFTNYTITDEVEGNIITRTIESNSLPTLMRFGVSISDTPTDRELCLLEIIELDTTELTSCNRMFISCQNVTSINTEGWTLEKVTDMYTMFYSCYNLTTLDVSNWKTCNVTDMSHMFEGCELTSIDISNWDTSKVTNMSFMFSYCYKLTSLDVSNWKTGKVTDMSYMFDSCEKLTSIDVSNFDTSKVTSMESMFCGCNKLTSLDVSNFDTSNVTNMTYMFYHCYNLTTLDVSNWNTSKVTNMNNMFELCKSLTYLDLRSFDTSSVTSMYYMFANCPKLISLDISNVNLNKCRNFEEAFSNTLLKDIGMIYCDKDTINKVASLLSTNIPRTIWVESDDILQYDQYDHITYKTQKVQDTVHLNSPLLKGDTIEVIDGKTYHVHRWEKIVLNGSEDWICYANGDITSVFCLKTLRGKLVDGIDLYCDKFPSRFSSWNVNSRREGVQVDADIALTIQINNNKLSTQDVNGFKQWLQQNPTTVVYELATPYYELISEEPLELTLLDTTDNTINNNSILPSNMTIVNKELSTIAIKPSTTYTLSFDKSNEDSEVTIDICGGEQITTVLNRIELTTPSELGSGIRFISSDGCIISNVRLLEGSLVKEAIPKETFEGLQSSFDEGYIIGENLVDRIITNVGQYGAFATIPVGSLKPSTNYTLILRNNGKYINGYINEYFFEGTAADRTFNINTNNYFIRSCKTLNSINVDDHRLLKSWDAASNIDIEVIFLEGDHTHLSKTELMRYIEKGTSHYEEEDFNHVGKYKVQYKVTGKNKAGDITPAKGNANDNHWIVTDNNNGTFTVKNDGYTGTSEGFALKLHANVKPNTTYTFTYKVDGADWNEGSPIFIYRDFYSLWDKTKFIIASQHTNTIAFTTPSDVDKICIGFHYSMLSDVTERIISNIQLEEGTVATEYEPYKENIKTYYLSSPLLEGDTIEDISGVATHVKRYEKVVLDGSEEWIQGVQNPSTNLYPKHYRVTNGKSYSLIYCDKFIHKDDYYSEIDCVYLENDALIFMSKEDINGFKQWLQANPVTAVYQLASPQYEPISEESILLDSYTNGHLDLSNENIPIEKVSFIHWSQLLAYLQPSTKYKIQFNSDNIGFLQDLGIGGAYIYQLDVTKGVNIFEITTGANLNHNALRFNGIGFNASNIQVVATDRDVDFDYFKGLQSSFEDGLITDENDENYGKYKVECKIVGKNKFDGELEYGRYNYINGIKDADNNTSYMRFPKLIPIKNGSVRATVFGIDGDVWFVVYNTNGRYIDFGKAYDLSRFDGSVGYISFYMVQPSFADNWYIQIEEGTQATSYEPYKESIHTLYLNSPLLKGDKLVVHDGKLCHYHKMGMVVLDGNNILSSNTNVANGFLRVYMYKLDKKALYPGLEEEPNCYSNQLQTLSRNFWANFNIESVSISDVGQLTFSKKIDTLESFKQWLQANPTTVVYELAEPYYEPIEPQLSSNSFSTVKDGDMEIITVLPIEKVNLTYRTDINGVSSIEEQIASIQEGTDISSIIDEEVDE